MDPPAHTRLALVAAILLAAGAAGADVLITEIMANPAGDEHTGEWIELYNTGPRHAYITGWFIGVEHADTVYSDAIYRVGTLQRVAPGGYGIVVDPGCVTEDGLCLNVPDSVTVFTIESGGFGRYGITNGGGMIRLNRSRASIIDATEDEVTYPGDQVIEGFSVERIDYTRSGLDPGNWATSHVPGGTPGAPNTAGQAIPGAVSLRLGPSVPTDHVTIAVELPVAPVRLTITVYDRYGRLVRRVADGSQHTAVVALVWDGRDEHGHHVATGPYVVLLEAVGVETSSTYRATGRAVIAR